MEGAEILIADASEEFIDALSAQLPQSFQVRGTCDGRAALQLLRQYHPDVLVLDLILPGLDGITLLQTAAQEGILPKVLASTRFLSDYVANCVSALGVGYLMVKPCEIGAVASRIRDMVDTLDQNENAPESDPRINVSHVLLQLGFSTKLRGYGSLRESILVFAQDTSQSITKELYPAVAAQCAGASTAQVEHAIRSAIKAAWSRRDPQIWQRYFPTDETGISHCPTNGEFISRIADPLSLEIKR